MREQLYFWRICDMARNSWKVLLSARVAIRKNIDVVVTVSSKMKNPTALEIYLMDDLATFGLQLLIAALLRQRENA